MQDLRLVNQATMTLHPRLVSQATVTLHPRLANQATMTLHPRLVNQATVTLHPRLANQATMTPHPTVPNPYTLLRLLSPSAKIYTCLDLKNAFFCICLIPVSQPIFAFEWDNPAGGSKQQLPGLTSHKDLRIPTTIFGEALASNLDSLRPEQFSCWLLQYVDDLPLAAKNGEDCWEGTKAFLQLLLEFGYQV